MQTFLGTFGAICRMVKIEHSIFALPYAWAGSCLAAKGWPHLSTFIYLTLAMIAIRSFAMAVNRLADLPYDKVNPRTVNRPLVTGTLTVSQTVAFSICMGYLFIFFCAALNELCFKLSFLALSVVLIYSYLKRYTALCHFWLGATLGLAPIAGWLSVDPSHLPMAPILLGLAVLFWVAAFDIYYAFQDVDFDRTYGLHSMPADKGQGVAMSVAGFSHTMTGLFLVLCGIAYGLSAWWYAVCFLIFVLLIMEHKLMLPSDMRNINMVFFTINGIISPVMLIGILLGIFC